MNNCCDLYFLSTLACRIGECLDDDELALLAANLMTLGDLLGVLIAKKAICAPESAEA